MIQRLVNAKQGPYFVVFFSCFLIIPLMVLTFVHFRSTRQIIPDDQLLYTSPTDSDHYKVKDKDATITFVNYFSMDCVHCRKAFLMEDTLLGAEHSKKINIIYRHNPLDSQPLSYEKALLTECVYTQSNDETFFNMLRDVFTHYNEEAKDNLWVKKIAEKYVSRTKDFNDCLENGSVKKQIEDHKKSNLIAGITYTPTVLIFEKNRFIKKYDAVGEHFVTNVLEYYLDH